MELMRKQRAPLDDLIARAGTGWMGVNNVGTRPEDLPSVPVGAIADLDSPVGRVWRDVPRPERKR